MANNKHKTINIKQETIKSITPSALLAALEISETVANDFIQLRNRLKAPVTKTALEGIQREAERAGISTEVALRICCERSWRGFKAEWLNNATPKSRDDEMQRIADELTGRNRNAIANIGY